MKYVIFLLLLVSVASGNQELDKYLEDKDLQYAIIRDKKNNRIIIDLLYDLKGRSRIIIFTKNGNDYEKTFDEKLYFCQNTKYSNIMVVKRHEKLYVECSMPNVDNGYYKEFYDFGKLSTLDDKLISIEKQYINIDDDSIKSGYIFRPTNNILSLRNYTNANFSDDYLAKNDRNFIKEKLFTPQNLDELLNAIQNKQPNTIVTTDFNVIFSNEKLTTKTLQKYNDTAYYLEQAGAYKESAYLLEKILEKYPDRTVAHYNLGDAYWGLGEKEKAIASYNTYIQQMKANGKEKRIPQVVLDRVNTKEAVK